MEGREDPRFPGNDSRYLHIDADQLPLTESLQLTVERVLPFWSDTIVPALQSRKNVIVVAHGNSLRVRLFGTLCRCIELFLAEFTCCSESGALTMQSCKICMSPLILLMARASLHIYLAPCHAINVISSNAQTSISSACLDSDWLHAFVHPT